MVDSAFAEVNQSYGTIPHVSGRKRGPYAGTQQRRAAIMAATYELVRDHGHRSTTAAGVAERAGVTESAVLYHFPSKEHLYVAVFEHLLSGVMHRVGHETPAELETFLVDLVTRDTQHPHIARLYQVLMAESSDPSHPAHTVFRARTELVVGALASDFEGFARTGQVQLVSTPERCARIMVGAWDGLQAQWFIRPEFDLAQDVVAAFRAVAPH